MTAAGFSGETAAQRRLRLPDAALRPWPAALGVLTLTLVLTLLVHGDTAVSIAATWARSGTYAHGWLIGPLAFYLAWRQRAALAELQPRPFAAGIAVFAAVEILWVVATVAEIVFLRQLALVAFIPAAVLALLGPAVTRRLAFPLGYLVFAVPWGEGFVPTLQDITAWASVTLLKLSAIPVFWEGRMISIPAGDFVVAEACSGVRYLIASLALGALYAHLAYRSAWRRAAFMGAALVVPIAANGLRAYGIIMIAHWSDMRLATGVDHLLYGWVFFGLVMFALVWLGSLWREPTDPAAAPPAGAAGDRSRRQPGTARWAGRGAAGFVLVAVAAAGAAVPGLVASAQPVANGAVSLPAPAAGWGREPADRPGWLAGFAGADEVVGASYAAPGDADAPVTLVVVHYRRERQGAELVNAANHLAGGNWVWLGEGRVAAGAAGAGTAVRELRLRHGTARRLVWSWHEVGPWRTPSGAVAKGMAALRRLTLQTGDATLVALAVPFDTRPERARGRLRDFIEAHPAVAAPGGLVREEGER